MGYKDVISKLWKKKYAKKKIIHFVGQYLEIGAGE